MLYYVRTCYEFAGKHERLAEGEQDGVTDGLYTSTLLVQRITLLLLSDPLKVDKRQSRNSRDLLGTKHSLDSDGCAPDCPMFYTNDRCCFNLIQFDHRGGFIAPFFPVIIFR